MCPTLLAQTVLSTLREVLADPSMIGTTPSAEAQSWGKLVLPYSMRSDAPYQIGKQLKNNSFVVKSANPTLKCIVFEQLFFTSLSKLSSQSASQVASYSSSHLAGLLASQPLLKV